MEVIEARCKSVMDYEKMAQGKGTFVDEVFPNTIQSLLGRHGTDNRELTTLAQKATWVRARDAFKGKPYFVFQKIEVSDIQQRSLGDCYLLCSIATLAEDPARVEELFLTRDANQAGCYALGVYIMGQKTVVVLDEYIPMRPAGGFCFVEPSGEEMWVVLLEKAWAKINGSYARIEGGN